MKPRSLPLHFALLALLATSGCLPSTPPDNIVRQGVEQSVRMQAIRANPFTRDVYVRDYVIDNQYTQPDGLLVYRYTAYVDISVNYGPKKKFVTMFGKEGFIKEGDQWRATGVD